MSVDLPTMNVFNVKLQTRFRVVHLHALEPTTMDAGNLQTFDTPIERR
jgi:hypothetical protein